MTSIRVRPTYSRTPLPLCLLAIALFLIVDNSHSSAMKLPPRRLEPASAQEVIKSLTLAIESGDDRTPHICNLGDFQPTQQLMMTLVHQIDYESPAPAKTDLWHGTDAEPERRGPFPAQVILVRIGQPAVPLLVQEYIDFWEINSFVAWPHHYGSYAADQSYTPLPKQIASSRLHAIAKVLSATDEMAIPALRQLEIIASRQQGDTRVGRACNSLINAITEHEHLRRKHAIDG